VRIVSHSPNGSHKARNDEPDPGCDEGTAHRKPSAFCQHHGYDNSWHESAVENICYMIPLFFESLRKEPFADKEGQTIDNLLPVRRGEFDMASSSPVRRKHYCSG
jgi:hypothetical protein